MNHDPSTVNSPYGWHFCKHRIKPGWHLRWIENGQAYTCWLDDLTPDAQMSMIEKGHIAQYSEMIPVEFPPQ